MTLCPHCGTLLDILPPIQLHLILTPPPSRPVQFRPVPSIDIELKKLETVNVSPQPTVTYSKLTIETLEQGRRFVVFIVNFEHILHLVVVFLLLTLSRYMPALAGHSKCRTIQQTRHSIL